MPHLTEVDIEQMKQVEKEKSAGFRFGDAVTAERAKYWMSQGMDPLEATLKAAKEYGRTSLTK